MIQTCSYHLLLSTNSSIYDVIVLNETWLSPDQKDCEFLDKQYKAYRKDRAQSNITETRGGGVLIAVLNKIECEEIKTPEMLNLEAVCIKISLPKGFLFIYSAYIQPSSSSTVYDDHFTAIKSIQYSKSDQILITGDFNLATCKWQPNDDGFDYIPIIGESESRNATTARKFTSAMLENDLFQICNIPNKSNNVLDLIYTNIPEISLAEKADILLIPDSISDKAHNQIMCTIECQPITFNSNSTGKPIFCFKKADYDAMNDSLNNIDFDELFNNCDINEMVDKFYNILYDLYEEFVPKSSIRSSNNPMWFDKKLINLKNIRNRQYKKLCKNRLKDINADQSLFIKARDDFDTYNKIKYEAFITDIVENNKNNPKKFWRFVNGKRKSNTLPCKMTLNGEIATNDNEQASLFAKFFASVYADRKPDDELQNFINDRCERNTFRIVPSIGAIHAVLQQMDLSKGMGADMVPPSVMRNCADTLAKPLHLLFTKSLTNVTYPNQWKIGQITPIFKSGKKCDVQNYRGVNVMPNVAKVFEKVLYNQLRLIIMPRINKNQHGFLTNRNIETNLMEFTLQIHKAFDNNLQVDAFYADISKAFDKVNQYLLIRKLAKFPVSNSTLLWFISYLSDRKQFVRVGSASSNFIDVTSSVGQGSVLGPLLFLAFFNDSDDDMDVSTTNSFNFADDKKIACTIKNIYDTRNLQLAINKFIKWCDNNDLEVNLSKCKVITFSHKQQPIICDYYIKNQQKIERVYEIRDLGVILNSKLDFKSHIEYTIPGL